MNKLKVELIATAYKPDQIPQILYPEIAIVGRSNVGKSSLINAMFDNKKLARVSSKPGKTASINFYLVNDTFLLVDLPGYGYAKRSAEERKKWKYLVDSYVTERENLCLFLHLVDFRHGFLDGDLRLREWILSLQVPVQVVFTKVDKVPKAKRKVLYEKYINSNELLSIKPPILTSAVTKEGIDKLWEFIFEFIDKIPQEVWKAIKILSR